MLRPPEISSSVKLYQQKISPGAAHMKNILDKMYGVKTYNLYINFRVKMIL